MRFLPFAFVTAALVAAASAGHAQSADRYPWCYIDQTMSGATYCAFATLAQCRENAGGNGGTCIQNPDYRGSAGRSAPHGPRR